ncbi:hypothetical protein [Vibrio agarivorans]|uniref:hypothetical protein n=1 Tax=Vibrio agarivorans TaxID=153622 RepID=UPI0025B31C9F|nr:hypothetical protein [Vibrio agarivorans]MDN3660165.1 hypothetical protein [Vibrio agarivorans]
MKLRIMYLVSALIVVLTTVFALPLTGSKGTLNGFYYGAMMYDGYGNATISIKIDGNSARYSAVHHIEGREQRSIDDCLIEFEHIDDNIYQAKTVGGSCGQYSTIPLSIEVRSDYIVASKLYVHTADVFDRPIVLYRV